MTVGDGLVLAGLRAAHGSTEILHGIDLQVASGELLVVLGPSGAGKSTLLRVVAGLVPATAGRGAGAWHLPHHPWAVLTRLVHGRPSRFVPVQDWGTTGELIGWSPGSPRRARWG